MKLDKAKILEAETKLSNLLKDLILLTKSANKNSTSSNEMLSSN